MIFDIEVRLTTPDGKLGCHLAVEFSFGHFPEVSVPMYIMMTPANVPSKVVSVLSAIVLLAACSDTSAKPSLEGRYKWDDGGAVKTATLDILSGGSMVFCTGPGFSCNTWVWEKTDDNHIRVSRGSADFGPPSQVCGYSASPTTVLLTGCPFFANVTFTRL